MFYVESHRFITTFFFEKQNTLSIGLYQNGILMKQRMWCGLNTCGSAQSSLSVFVNSNVLLGCIKSEKFTANWPTIGCWTNCLGTYLTLSPLICTPHLKIRVCFNRFLNYFSQNIDGKSRTNILPHCSNTLLHKGCLLYSVSNKSIKILIGWSFVFTVFMARIVKPYRIVQRQSFLNVTHRAVQFSYWNC